ncbi:MAG: hypothetical protein RKO24_13680, partial [Candidatus Competibacter sp.]|nr:hypothetical protein [Candidatus Competibacter sp.]
MSTESTIRWAPWPSVAMLVALLLVMAFPEPAPWPPRRTGFGRSLPALAAWIGPAIVAAPDRAGRPILGLVAEAEATGQHATL